MTLNKLTMIINKFGYYLAWFAFLAPSISNLFGIDLGISIENRLLWVGFMVFWGTEIIRTEIKDK